MIRREELKNIFLESRYIYTFIYLSIQYQLLSSNPTAVPKTKLDYMDPVSNLGSTVLVNLAVVRVTSLNKADSPCVEEEDYSWTQCVKLFISEVKHKTLKHLQIVYMFTKTFLFLESWL